MQPSLIALVRWYVETALGSVLFTGVLMAEMQLIEISVRVKVLLCLAAGVLDPVPEAPLLELCPSLRQRVPRTLS